MLPVDGREHHPSDDQRRQVEAREAPGPEYREHLAPDEEYDDEVSEQLKQVARVVQEPVRDQRPEVALLEPEGREAKVHVQAAVDPRQAHKDALDHEDGHKERDEPREDARPLAVVTVAHVGAVLQHHQIVTAA
jgi:hypothetical protein